MLFPTASSCPTFAVWTAQDGPNSKFVYEPMLRWLSKRNKRMTDPGLLNVLKRLAGPSIYSRLHQVLLARVKGDRDEITIDQFRDVCAR